MTPDIGSTWRRWDLHIHTPASHTAKYGTSGEAWERFISDLEALPEEMCVIGVNDYMWVDGYERVLEARGAGRLANIVAIFPVVELRLASFVGTDSRLQRVNAHAIFAPDTDPDVIRTQFISRLVTRFALTSPYEEIQQEWNAVATREALEELGRLIKASVPEDQRKHFGPDLDEGYNNWVVPLETVLDAVRDASMVEPPLVGLGKTEWADIPWGNHTIATKKTLISRADLLFTAAESPAAANHAQRQLQTAGVNERLLDCSDAHDYSSANYKDRIGNCCTWICADPTLAGLKHALLEYESRVFLGEKPPLLVRQESDPTHFVSRVRIAPSGNNRPSPGFDVDIPLNGGFVAVIGKKGSGKSALLDSVALAANSHSEGSFTFLSETRFRNPRQNKSASYAVELGWHDGEMGTPVPLSSHVDLESPEGIRYLPQSLLESLCNKEPGSPDDAFEQELRGIIFSHVPDHQRGGARGLDELLLRRGRALDTEIAQKRSELSGLNRRISSLEERLRPSRLRALKKQLAEVKQQLLRHDQKRPPDPTPPLETKESDPVAAELAKTARRLEVIAEQEAQITAEYGRIRRRLDAVENLQRELALFDSRFKEFTGEISDLLSESGLELDAILRISIDAQPLVVLRADLESKLAELEPRLGETGEIAQERSNLHEKGGQLTARLEEPQRMFEERKSELARWEAARQSLVGDPTSEGTLRYIETEISEAQVLPLELEELRTSRMERSRDIHSLLLEKVEMFKELHAPVQQFIDRYSREQEDLDLEFEAQLEIGEFTEPFLSDIHHGMAGTYYRTDWSAERVAKRVKAVRPHEWDSVREFIEEHDKDLHYDRRESDPGTPVDCPADLLRKGASLQQTYDFLYGLPYLRAEYELRSDGRSISELSPGQKGTILLLFYLLVDRSGKPIALDQPDENLDNETVHADLRPAIRNAKRSRQVFVVTHSPNLAVVGDADQVIVASNDGTSFTYETGSIENPTIRDLVVRVLEGTWPAFSNRGSKYEMNRQP